MLKWISDLFLINRSITGEGVRKTLSYFKKINPEIKLIKFKTGKKVFDWKIPEEWLIKDAYIQNQKGQKFAEFKKNNLHIVGYSTPINKWIDKNSLLKKIYTLKEYKSYIPYVTSYYKKDWGFCMSEQQKKKFFKGGKFKVKINSKFKKGFLNCAHAIIKGKSKKEVFFSTNICHPSMANNELSGPALINAILLYLKKNHPNNYYTYRFVLVPETIGSIAYLSKYLKSLKKNIFAGYVLSCVGDDNNYSIIQSRDKNNLSEKMLFSFLENKKNLKIYSYLERGSDERQYCSPGIDLPLCGFSRSKYAEYKEYHSSADNLSFISKKGLNNSLNVFSKIIDLLEIGIVPKRTTLGEPFLAKRKLHNNKSFWNKQNYEKNLKLRMDFLAYCDSETDIFDTKEKIGCSFDDLVSEYKLLLKSGVIKSGHY
jgi:aminopeptidase-like protein